MNRCNSVVVCSTRAISALLTAGFSTSEQHTGHSIASLPNKFVRHYPPKSVISDMKWWLDTLRVPGVARSLTPRMPLKDADIWVDASSSWGIGILFGDRWAAWSWDPASSWRGCGRDIGWAEMVAVELAARYVSELGYSNVDVLIYSDNAGVVGAYNRGRSRNFQVNEAIRRVDTIGMTLNILFRLEYVNTKNNLADPVSRGEPVASMSRLPQLELPAELSTFLISHA